MARGGKAWKTAERVIRAPFELVAFAAPVILLWLAYNAGMHSWRHLLVERQWPVWAGLLTSVVAAIVVPMLLAVGAVAVVLAFFWLLSKISFGRLFGSFFNS